MSDASRQRGAQRLAPVSYLPWAVPGVDRSVPGKDETEPDQSRAGTSVNRAGAGNASVTPIGGGDPARAEHRRRTQIEHGEHGEHGEPDSGVERDVRIDRLVIGRLRRSSLSIAEVRAVLVEHGLDDAEVEEWIERYERLGYLNDVRLAEQLVRTGAERQGRGSAAILAELSRRGVSAEATRAALESLDPDLERRNAFAVAERRARQLRGLDRAVAERRLSAFLQRRGYGSAVVREAVHAALSTD